MTSTAASTGTALAPSAERAAEEHTGKLAGVSTGNPAKPAPAAAPGSSSRARRVLAVVAVPALALALGIGVWYAVSYLLLDPARRFLLPPPHQVVSRSLADPVHLEPMLQALGVTARIAAIGFVLAALIGIGTGSLMNQARWVERLVYPYAVMLQVIPVLAIVPLIGLWFGFGTGSRVIVCVMIALFPVITNTHFGLRSVDRGLHELFTLGRASRVRRLVSLELPAALPSVFTGLRIASGQVVIGAILGDMFFAKGEPGIGTLLDTYRATLRSEDLIAAIALASLFGIAVYTVFTLVSQAVVGRWHSSGDRR
ncbi:ABC transporter permease [Streptomyces sp. NBC_00059]|uniref:ABC transporter permease n=1 Tax=Streptomyces sp. NBC_00059 TaxID=2975635 RepID=UPI0022558905|nr:ABC transporter permease [Streptomyces sp. NBC_00059]MCX5413577.1 ABC transporter permease [Streptomyces sp. NBC_00059]